MQLEGAIRTVMSSISGASYESQGSAAFRESLRNLKIGCGCPAQNASAALVRLQRSEPFGLHEAEAVHGESVSGRSV
jgi:hypothetical protein